jgi:alpha-galactosidase
MSPLAISFGTPHETKGEVRAFAFVYSGNFLVEAELGEMGRLRYTMGIHPMGMQWHLNAGEFFATPEVVMVRSSDGIGGMSRTFHRLFLERLLPKNWSDKNPPILLNTWEAKYFHVTHDNVIEMARQVR